MNLEAVYFISQVIAAVALVGSLIFVGMQIRAQVRQSRMDAVLAMMNAFADGALPLANNQNLAKYWRKSLSTPLAEMDSVEATMVGAYIQRHLRLTEATHYQYRMGQIDQSAWDGQIALMQSFKSAMAVQTIWKDRGHMFSAEFQDFWNSLDSTGYVQNLTDERKVVPAPNSDPEETPE